MWSSALNITRDIKNFVKISTILVLFKNMEIWIKFSGNVDSTNKAHHILEMPGQWEFCGYWSKKLTYDWISKISSKTTFKASYYGHVLWTPCIFLYTFSKKKLSMIEHLTLKLFSKRMHNFPPKLAKCQDKQIIKTKKIW